MDNQIIVVLDFASGEVHIYNTQETPTTEQAEIFLTEKGHRVKDCNFMIMDVLAIHFH